MADIKPIPDGFTSLTPYLTMTDSTKAIAFYEKAFGAEAVEVSHSPDGKVMNAQIRIGDTMLMMSDHYPEYGGAPQPSADAPIPFTIHLYVEDVDKTWQNAVDAGCTVLFPLADMFWGDKFGKLKDPFGYEWSLASHTRDLTPEQMQAEMAAAFGGHQE